MLAGSLTNTSFVHHSYMDSGASVPNPMMYMVRQTSNQSISKSAEYLLPVQVIDADQDYMRIHLKKNRLGDSYENATLSFMCMIPWKDEGERFLSMLQYNNWQRTQVRDR